MPNTPAAFLNPLKLSNFDGDLGTVFNGVSAKDLSGSYVASAGDFNGDGLNDLVIAAPYASPDGRDNAGSIFLIFGTSTGFDAVFELSSLDGANGIRINGVLPYDRIGHSIASIGDINGDGFDDLLIGAPRANRTSVNASFTTSAGASFVVFGAPSGYGAVLELSSLNGTNGFKINGAAGDGIGFSVAGGCDINGDTKPDMIIGAPGASPDGRTNAGVTYVIFGVSNYSYGAVFELSSLNGTNGFRINGILATNATGCATASISDFNHDGFGDVFIGMCPELSIGRSSAGAAYMVYGTSAGFGASFELSSLNGTNGFRINGASAGDNIGSIIASAGDIDGDGKSDVIIGAPKAEANAGSVILLFGASSSESVLELSSLNGTNGFRINGDLIDNYNVVSSVAITDINGDNYSDFVIGSPPEVYVLFGAPKGSYGATLKLSSLNGINGFKIKGVLPSHLVGHSIANVGDVNRDGIDDVLMGAPQFSPGGREWAGVSYLVLGDIAPVLVNNTLNIGAGCTMTLDATNLAAYDANHANSTLIFSASNVSNGYFQTNVLGKVTLLTQPVFQQSDIAAGHIQFVSTNNITPSYNMMVNSTGLAFVPATPALVNFNLPACSIAPTQMPSFTSSATPTPPVVSSGVRIEPVWFLPISQTISLLDAGLPKIYQSVSDYLPGSGFCEKPIDNPLDNSSLQGIGTQLILGAVALKLVQKSISWARSFWTTEPKLGLKSVLPETTQNIQTVTIVDEASLGLSEGIEHLCQKIKTSFDDNLQPNASMIDTDFQKPSINFAYKRMVGENAVVEQTVSHTPRLVAGSGN